VQEAREFHSRAPGRRFGSSPQSFDFNLMPGRISAGVTSRRFRWDILGVWTAGLAFCALFFIGAYYLAQWLGVL